MHEREVAALQQAIADKHARAAETQKGTAERRTTVEALITATRKLLAYEDALPALLDEPAQAISALVVRGSGMVAATGAIVTAACVFRGPLGWGWYLAAAAGALAATAFLKVPVRAAGDRHRAQRWSSIVGAALTAALAPAGIWVGWWAGVLLTIAVLGTNGYFTGAFDTPAEGSQE